MRIALIHYRLLRNGGLETRLFNYLNYFHEQGHEVTLIVSKIDPNVTLHKGITIEQVNLKRVPKPLRQYFFDGALDNIIPKGNFDLSFSLGRTSNQDMVLCPGNHLGYLKAMGISFPSLMDRLNIYLDRQAYRKSKLTLACSEMMKQELIELFGVQPDKIRVLLPPIDTSRFNKEGKKNKKELRKKYGFSGNKKSLLFLTTGNKRKGYPFLLKLMKTLKDDSIELIVAGVKPMASSLPNVKYIGYAERSEELLWATDALIHPALYEPFGQVITEAIQCGSPVVISDMVGAKEIVDEGVGRVVEGFAINEWKETIISSLNKDWNITPEFATMNGLTVAQHCQKILDYRKEIQSAKRT
ncbi:MAG: glycosyltransferase family 4 protein [Bacteroidetes bacterium]|nr:glycosyltransferase family 4 protein [Bacteroidota bacterium]